MRNYYRYQDPELRAMLAMRGLPDFGNRDDLINRLRADDFPGHVEIPNPEDPPPLSSLVEAFENRADRASDAIVLRGYLGRSTLLYRVVQYLERAGAAEAPDADREDLAPAEVRRRLREALPADDNAPLPEIDIDLLIGVVNLLGDVGERHIPWRLYLTPQLDTYVDFHFNSMLAYRQEPKAERHDACTVWLRLFEPGDPNPIPYRVVHETLLGPSFAQWVGGELVDDHLAQAGSVSTAWGDQSSLFGGGRPGTGARCGLFGGGRPGTGARCGE
jgi:hypothetical protein